MYSYPIISNIIKDKILLLNNPSIPSYPLFYNSFIVKTLVILIVWYYYYCYNYTLKVPFIFQLIKLLIR